MVINVLVTWCSFYLGVTHRTIAGCCMKLHALGSTPLILLLWIAAIPLEPDISEPSQYPILPMQISEVRKAQLKSWLLWQCKAVPSEMEPCFQPQFCSTSSAFMAQGATISPLEWVMDTPSLVIAFYDMVAHKLIPIPKKGNAKENYCIIVHSSHMLVK